MSPRPGKKAPSEGAKGPLQGPWAFCPLLARLAPGQVQRTTASRRESADGSLLEPLCSIPVVCVRSLSDGGCRAATSAAAGAQEQQQKRSTPDSQQASEDLLKDFARCALARGLRQDDDEGLPASPCGLLRLGVPSRMAVFGALFDCGKNRLSQA